MAGGPLLRAGMCGLWEERGNARKRGRSRGEVGVIEEGEGRINGRRMPGKSVRVGKRQDGREKKRWREKKGVEARNSGTIDFWAKAEGSRSMLSNKEERNS